MHSPDAKCARCCPEDLVVVTMAYNEHTAGPSEGFDLASIPVTDVELLDLAMEAFKINPGVPNAREQLRRTLRKQIRRNGRPPEDFRLGVAMTLEGATDADTAPTVAERIAPYFPNRKSTSLTQKVQHFRRGR